MQRMSDPQIVVLFVRTSTSPWSGTGTSNVRSSTVLFPGSTAPVMRSGRVVIGASGMSILVQVLRRALPARHAIARRAA